MTLCRVGPLYLFFTPIYLSWAMNCGTIQRNYDFTKKAVRINFQPKNSHTSRLFKQSSILKLQDKICLENILFVSKSLIRF